MPRQRSSKDREATARYWGKSLERPDWFSVRGEAGEDLEVFIYDVIGWPFDDVSNLVQLLAAEPERNVYARINSPGGDVFDGLALFNALKSHRGRVTTRIEGLAASMASVIAMAGDEVQAHKSAMLMIHEPWVFAAGDQHELRDIAEVLGKISGNLLNIYYEKAGAGKRQLRQEMEDETWFTAEEAKTRNLIDTVLDEPVEKTAFDLSMFNHAPEGFRKPEGRDLSEREVERALRDAGASKSFAREVVHNAVKPLRDAGVESATEAANTLLESLRA